MYSMVNTDVRELEEYIQEEAKAVKEKVKQLEVTIIKQMEVIERQENEIEKLARDLTKQDAHVGAQEGARQELLQEGAGQEVLQEGAGQELAQDEDQEEAGDRNESWQENRRYRFECPICGLGRKTRGQVEQHMTTHEKQEEDSQFNCKDCQYQTMNRDQLYQHMDLIHKKFECNLCNTLFKTRKDLNIHSKEAHNKKFIPCRNFPSKKCEYDSECSFLHIILNQGEHVCFKCGDVFKNKTLMVNHIKSDHGQETCKRFQENKCSFGEKCFYRHILNARSVRTPQESSVPTSPHTITPQVFQQAPTSWNRVVGPQIQSEMIMNMNQMSRQMGIMMSQMSQVLSQLNLN